MTTQEKINKAFILADNTLSEKAEIDSYIREHAPFQKGVQSFSHLDELGHRLPALEEGCRNIHAIIEEHPDAYKRQRQFYSERQQNSMGAVGNPETKSNP